MTGEVNMILEDEVVKLESFELKNDIDYVLYLIMKCRYTRVSREVAKKALVKFDVVFWHVLTKKEDTLIGVIYLTKTPGGWMLDAYRDDALVKSIDNTMDYSYRAGKLISDFASKFTKKLLTMHAFENKAATAVCKKMGFEEDFIIMKKEM